MCCCNLLAQSFSVLCVDLFCSCASESSLFLLCFFEHTVMHWPSEALVLSHESAPAPLWEPYLAHLFTPIKPMVLFGRDASLQPRIPVANAVWYGWKDFDWRNHGGEIHTVLISILISVSMLVARVAGQCAFTCLCSDFVRLVSLQPSTTPSLSRFA